MIFKQHDLVISGRKTQTRRLWKPTWEHGVLDCISIVAIFNNGRVQYAIGRLLPIIPKRAQPAIRIEGEIARVCVVALRRERLQDITEADAIAEGVNSVAEYRELWTSINGKTKGADWDSNPYVAVISFKMVVPIKQLEFA